jgi:hypothetical protein
MRAHLLAERAMRRNKGVVMRLNMPEEIRGLVLAEATAVARFNNPCNSIPAWSMKLLGSQKKKNLTRTCAVRFPDFDESGWDSDKAQNVADMPLA